MGRLDNKVALITGGASGIGRATALRFAKEGADVCVADINLVGAKTTAQEIEGAGGNSLAVQVDVTKPADIDKMVTATINHFGRIDILTNAAGVFFLASALEVTEADWDKIININLKGLFFTTQRVLRHMLKQGKGKVINLASNLGAVGDPNASVYCTSKGGIVNLTKALALEFAPKKININAIGPAFTETPMTKPFMDDTEAFTPLLKNIPLGRVAQPEEIASAAVYLASDESDFVTGHTLFVDGGYLSQ